MAKQLLIAGKDPAKLNTNYKPGILTSLSGGVRTVSIEKISTAEPFKSLFAIKDEVLESIAQSMKSDGYDTNQPVIIWKEQDVLLDGHTRLQAARIAGITSIPAFYASFGSEEDVLDYMHRLQFSRRNITDSDLIRLIINALPAYEKKYGEGSKAEFLTKRFVGLSEGKAKQAAIVIEAANMKILEKIEVGEISIYQAYLKIKEDKNTPKQKVSANFFIDDGNRQPVRFDDNGNFYYRNYDKMKEVKAFALPTFMNTPKIRERIQRILDEELGDNHAE